MSESSTDCLECRLTSGGGLLLCGFYLYYCSQKHQNFNRYALIGLAPGVGLLGLLRIFNLPPFRHATDELQEPKKEITEQDSYIIGKLPTKFP